MKLKLNEIKKIVNNFKSKTSTGYDDIDMCLVKKVIDYITVSLSKIFNLSFQQGIFPDRMKIAKVIPLFKAGQKNVFTNYHPVSLLPQFSKILEKLFCVRLDNFIDKCNILCENQYDFRSGRSTSLAIIHLIENITNMLDSKKKNTIGIFIDLKKAFDTIDHVLLLNKLEYYGVRGIVNDWLKSYLEWRKQFVLLDDIKSSLLTVLCDVPQGSILGRKLFILYINDIVNVSSILNMILFADDTNAFCSGSNLNELAKNVSGELDKLKDWFGINKLSLNVSKTNFMLFRNRNKVTDIKIYIKNHIIDRVAVTKFLGS